MGVDLDGWMYIVQSTYKPTHAQNSVDMWINRWRVGKCVDIWVDG